MRSRISGVVASISKQEGRQVKVGEVLATLSRHEAEIEVRIAQAELDVCRAEVEAAEADYAAAMMTSKGEDDRIDGQHSQTDEDPQSDAVEPTNPTPAILRASVHRHAARTKMAVAETRLNCANLQMDRTVIRAPLDGIVVRTYASEGEVVKAHHTPIFELISETRSVEFSVSPEELQAIRGNPEDSPNRVEVEVRCSGKRYEGQFGVVIPEVDRATQRCTVRCGLQGGTELMPGTKASVSITLQ
jgi:multidrug resistance efflux pump